VVLAALAVEAGLALYCRAEWLDARRQLDSMTLRADMEQESGLYWKRKYELLRQRKPLTARQEKLLQKYEAAQGK
jgi:hypothetical protein